MDTLSKRKELEQLLNAAFEDHASEKRDRGEKVSNGTIGEELHAEGKLSLESIDLDSFFLKAMNVLF